MQTVEKDRLIAAMQNARSTTNQTGTGMPYRRSGRN